MSRLIVKMSEKCILLFSSLSTDQIQIVNTRRLETLLAGQKLQVEKIDGSLEENKELRNQLFGISEQRGKYPQCFLLQTDGNYKFIGLWEEVENLIECNSLPKEVLDANPDIKTFSKVFKNYIIIISYHNIFSYIIIILNSYYRSLLMRQKFNNFFRDIFKGQVEKNDLSK